MKLHSLFLAAALYETAGAAGSVGAAPAAAEAPEGVRRGRAEAGRSLAKREDDGGADSEIPKKRGQGKNYIVKFPEEAKGRELAACQDLAKAYGGEVGFIYSEIFPGCSLNIPDSVVHTLESNPDVALFEEEVVWKPSSEPLDPFWGLDRINQQDLPLDKSITKMDASGVKVYVLDTGIQGDHKEFEGVIDPSSDCHKDLTGLFTGENGDPMEDSDGHGTHVASTACGNKYGVAGGCQLCSIKVCIPEGCPTASILAGGEFVLGNCAPGEICVVNISLGGPYSQTSDDAIAAAVYFFGITVVVSAGNDDSDACNQSPASSAAAITVGSTDWLDEPSYFTNWGTCVDVYAPGSNITAAVPYGDGIDVYSGTSMSSPHVAGIVAGHLGSGAAATPAGVMGLLRANWVKGDPGIDPQSPGKGLATVFGGPDTPCGDDPDWRREGKPNFSCSTVARGNTANRCEHRRSEDGVWADEACKKTCGTCGRPPRCRDDPDWRREGNPRLSCHTVARGNTANKCEHWRSEDGIWADDACKETCETCGRPPRCRDDPDWRREGTSNFSCRTVARGNTANRCRRLKDANGVVASDACKETCDSCDPEIDVVIIGAGAAGMAAARELVGRGGHSITILEATNRTGGRVRTETLGSTRVDLGAEEFYLDTPIVDAMEKVLGRETLKPYPLPSTFFLNETLTCSSKNESILANCADFDDWVGYDRIWKFHYRKSWREAPLDMTAEEKIGLMPFLGRCKQGERCWEWYNNCFAAEYGANMEQLGARSLGQEGYEWELPDEIYANTNPDYGYEDAMREALWKDTISDPGVTLMLERPVKSIDSSFSNVVKVTDADGNIYRTNYVIVTASLAVLQKGLIDFTPALPMETAKAINDLGIELAMKVYLKFDDDWWTEAVGAEATPGAIITGGLAAWCWPYYKDPSDDHILGCMTIGQKVIDLKANASDDEIIDRVLADLDATFPGAAQKPSESYSGDAIINDWGSEEYQGGGWTFPTVNSFYDEDSTIYEGNARAVLRTPVANGRILFAGEATSSTMIGTVPAAVTEGERAARAAAHPQPSPAPASDAPSTIYPTTEFPTTYEPTK